MFFLQNFGAGGLSECLFCSGLSKQYGRVIRGGSLRKYMTGST